MLNKPYYQHQHILKDSNNLLGCKLTFLLDTLRCLIGVYTAYILYIVLPETFVSIQEITLTSFSSLELDNCIYNETKLCFAMTVGRRKKVFYMAKMSLTNSFNFQTRFSFRQFFLKKGTNTKVY